MRKYWLLVSSVDAVQQKFDCLVVDITLKYSYEISIRQPSGSTLNENLQEVPTTELHGGGV